MLSIVRHVMETYAYLYGSDEGGELHRNVEFVSKKPEKGPDGTKGYCILLKDVPLVFLAYVQWAWRHHGRVWTNILLKISPYHWWARAPTSTDMPARHKAHVAFLVAAFQKRIINEDIRRQKHKLFVSLHTCKAEVASPTTRGECVKFSEHIKDCLEVAKGNYYPTPPPPEKCNYNTYIVYEQQRKLIRSLLKGIKRNKIDISQ